MCNDNTGNKDRQFDLDLKQRDQRYSFGLQTDRHVSDSGDVRN